MFQSVSKIQHGSSGAWYWGCCPYFLEADGGLFLGGAAKKLRMVNSVGRQQGIEVIRISVKKILSSFCRHSESAGLQTAVSRGSGSSVRVNMG